MKLLYRSKMPRPDDPEILDTICNALAKGHSQPSAAALAGIHEDTLFHWRYQGEAQLANLQGEWTPWEELGPHAQLVIRVKEARAGLMERALEGWWNGKVNDWARYATMLERVFPQDFGRQNRVEVVGEVRHLSLRGELPPQAMAELLRRGERRYIEAGETNGTDS